MVVGVGEGVRSPRTEERTGSKWRPRKSQDVRSRWVESSPPDFPTAKRFSSTTFMRRLTAMLDRASGIMLEGQPELR
jgi:hypothetical protein